MTYKLIASDLDGTLLNSQHAVSDLTINVIQMLAKNGFPFVIATGRHFLDVKDIRLILNVDMYVITANGARIHNREGEIIYQKNIEPAMVKALLRPEFLAGVSVNLYRDDGWWIDKPLPWLLDMHETSGFRYELFDPANVDGHAVSKIFYIADHSTLLILQAKLIAHFGNDALAITFSMLNCLEVMHKTVSKGEALNHVVQLQGLTLTDCLAFGDGLNDYELLSMVGKGLIMGNAHDALKVRLPHQEVVGHNTDDGVAKFLVNHYGLLM